MVKCGLLDSVLGMFIDVCTCVLRGGWIGGGVCLYPPLLLDPCDVLF